MKKENTPIYKIFNTEPFDVNKNHFKSLLKDKTILITGAAGTIGSNLVFEILEHQPKKIIAIDNSETALFYLNEQIKEHQNHLFFTAILADIRNKRRLKKIVKDQKPKIVFHCAAYKHVPLMESNPIEAITNNIFSTKRLANVALKNNVEHFIFISTDKAVNPSSIMGATKRIAEMYLTSLFNSLTSNLKTKFIITRFGNVIESNGSVIPLFKSQIARGGPVTITHKKATRYFITIQNACKLILESCILGKGGEIFIFNMGKPISINDLAHKMIRKEGLIPEKDIKIKIIGLRPGEKINEEQSKKEEKILKTEHPKIKKIKDEALTNLNALEKELKTLKKAVNKNNTHKSVEQLLQMVRGYNKILPED